jgi:8-oxo-dGTP pyrophosphatase MutT (NUDIX family)
MNYIAQLRARVGSMPLVLVGAAVIVRDREGHILLQRRKDNGLWGSLGGIIEPGESAESAARREVMEEAGLDVSSIRLVTEASGEGMFYRYSNGDEVHHVALVFEGIAERKERCDLDEGYELRWFPADAVPSEISPPTKIILERYAKAKKG